MQGSGLSSESIWTAFDSMTTAAIRPIRHILKIAWTRIQDTTVSAAIVDTSNVDGSDVIQGQSEIVTQLDYFEYFDETAHAIRLEYDRSVSEPVGGLNYTIGDILLDNNSLRFTPDQNATIGTALLPNKPTKFYMGFDLGFTEKVLPIMYGITTNVREDKRGRTVNVSVFDYMSYIDDFTLESQMYVDKTSDFIIDNILNRIGFKSSQYNLDVGLNIIPFAWFEKNDKAGDRIARICEAEEAMFYQDEFGILQFKNRRSILDAPYNASVWTFNPEDIVYWEDDDSTQIINRSVIKADIRSIKATTEVYRMGSTEKVPYGGSIELWASFEDPVTGISTPVITTDYIATYDEIYESTQDISSDIDIEVELFTTTAKITITNNYIDDAYVHLLKLRGTPATIDHKLEEVFEDTDSISQYGEKLYQIENDFIASESFAYYMTRVMVKKYKDPRRRIKITVPAVPQLQLLDRVTVKEPDLGTSNDYRVMKIQGTMLPGSFTQQITLRETSGLEADTPFIVDLSTVDSGDVVWT